MASSKGNFGTKPSPSSQPPAPTEPSTQTSVPNINITNEATSSSQAPTAPVPTLTDDITPPKDKGKRRPSPVSTLPLQGTKSIFMRDPITDKLIPSPSHPCNTGIPMIRSGTGSQPGSAALLSATPRPNGVPWTPTSDDPGTPLEYYEWQLEAIEAAREKAMKEMAARKAAAAVEGRATTPRSATAEGRRKFARVGEGDGGAEGNGRDDEANDRRSEGVGSALAEAISRGLIPQSSVSFAVNAEAGRGKSGGGNPVSALAGTNTTIPLPPRRTQPGAAAEPRSTLPRRPTLTIPSSPSSTHHFQASTPLSTLSAHRPLTNQLSGGSTSATNPTPRTAFARLGLVTPVVPTSTPASGIATTPTPTPIPVSALPNLFLAQTARQATFHNHTGNVTPNATFVPPITTQTRISTTPNHPEFVTVHSTTTSTVTHHFLVPRAQALAFAGQAAAQRGEVASGGGGDGASAGAGVDVGSGAGAGVDVGGIVESVETRTGRDRERQGRSERERASQRGRESQRERQTATHGAGRPGHARAAASTASTTATSRPQPVPSRANNTAPTPTNTPNASGGSIHRVLRSTTRALASPSGQLRAEIEDTTIAMADSESSPHVARRNAISSGSGTAGSSVRSAVVGRADGIGNAGRRPVNRGRAVPVVLPGKRKRGGTVGEWVRRVEEARVVGAAGEEEEEEDEEEEEEESQEEEEDSDEYDQGDD